MWISWWGEADLVVRGVFVTLVALSLLSWTVILYKSLLFAKLARLEAAVSRHLRDATAHALPTAMSMVFVVVKCFRTLC
ncbi:hypothetical protein Tel_13875 [Candidatus Tenderia electrophaga]|jgi:biopolymer transport protein ExbB|uniref:MotA/TolQ/ExbB proton channel domain-containing protein n=1 Tax=Candidatus Tenderia electrophaga TaxID=1748243 RepID=A0A0S2TG41_9GAMM|nr:hypothetical protein Tel_13875 [Candidatus Tenderia electrophaga]